MSQLKTYNYNSVDPFKGEAESHSLPASALPVGFYAAGTLLCYTAAGAWEVWAYANDPAVKGMASAMIQNDMNVTANGIVYGDVNATVPERGGYNQNFPVWIRGLFALADVLAAQSATITVANLGATKPTGLKLKGPTMIQIL